MQNHPRQVCLSSLHSFSAAALMLCSGAALAAGGYTQTNLVTDDQANLIASHYQPAATVDPNLINPWGLSFGPTSPVWVSNNGTGTSTLYSGTGSTVPLVVTVPGAPTGQVFAGGSLQLAGHAGIFAFASEDGTISQWDGSSTAATIAVDRAASGAIYKGLAMAEVGGEQRLFATDFHNNRIDVYDHGYGSVLNGAGAFTDPTLPAGYAPFGIQNIEGNLFVTYARQDDTATDDVHGIGHGFVDIFDTNGTLLNRLASRGVLNSPWAVVKAPSSFGEFAGDILVGNFGDGLINVFDPVTHAFVDHLVDKNGEAIVIDGLWGLAFGSNGFGFSPDKLYFAAGINDEAHGLFGVLAPTAVPLPASAPLLGATVLLLATRRRRAKRED